VSQAGLSAIVIRRIMLFSAVAMVAQFVGVVAEYWLDKQQTAQQAVERETNGLFKGFSRVSQEPGFELPSELVRQYGKNDGDYLARVRLKNGNILFKNCSGECDHFFLPLNQPTPEFWISWINLQKPLSVGGGRSFESGPDQIIVEVAILEDRQGVLFKVLAHEVLDHMVLPMSLILIFVLGATSLSINRALRPVKHAAELASALNPLDPHSRLQTVGMPREIARFTNAINKAFDAVRDVVSAQKDFTSAISHEVRTPLAIARLELEKISDPRARKVETDLGDLNHLVEQLTTLARLEGVSALPQEPVDLLAIAEAVVANIAPIVYNSGKTIELVNEGSETIPGYPALIENAIRNLIENAIHHSSPGSTITVVVGPGSGFSVRDHSDQISSPQPPASVLPRHQQQGLGLKIVQRIAEIHQAEFEFCKQPNVDAMAHFKFVPNKRETGAQPSTLRKIARGQE
jgi:signal transduction histidine kinase